ncbi:FUSC family protein [Streptomyces griseiscabiei]|uniref:FUSC family protein n=1 Tax=Streptomyces griseiscabiei TaxID=2993540 RepID=A0ABU4LJB1_9ACTN|nr:FUSC family protein [Streptomyces griseiscabiei]MDX2915797.1 FUSC family protein [Streptomyces griseiscabiei]
MSHPLTSRLAPPDWLVRTLRPQPAPVNRPAVARAAIALTLPLALGLAAGRPEYGALASMGALSGVISDTAAAYRMRLLNIAVPQLFAAVGITLGSLVYGQGWVTVGVLTGVALVSGMISSIGAVASVSGLLLLLNSVIGAGLPLPGPWWLAPLLMTGGGFLVLVLALLAWPLRAGVPERAAVADTYRKVADLLATMATTGTDTPTGPPDAYDEARRLVTQSLNQSYDLVLARRARHHGRSPELVRLLAQLNAITPLVEAAPAVRLSGRPLPAEIPVAVRHLAEAVETGYSGPLGLRLPEPTSAMGKAVDQALRHAAEVAGEKSPDALKKAGDRSGRPAPLGVRAARVARNVALSGTSWRYGLRLALCIGIAQALVSLVPVPRSYWVALTITFVLKPDFGSVFSRALLRALGTVVGLVVAAGILAEVPRGWWDVPVILLLAPLIPVFTPRGYGYQTAAITPVILLLSDILNHLGTGLLVPRLVDSLMGCAIALVAGYLLWPESWHARVGDRLADAVADTASYVERAFGKTPADTSERIRMRRRLYRDLSAVRTEFQRALTEPPPVGRRAAAWWPLVVAVERIVDATTAARVRVKQGAEPPSTGEVDQVTLQLRELAQGLRKTKTLYEVRSDLSGPPGSVLEPLRQEVAAARTITSPSH